MGGLIATCILVGAFALIAFLMLAETSSPPSWEDKGKGDVARLRARMWRDRCALLMFGCLGLIFVMVTIIIFM